MTEAFTKKKNISEEYSEYRIICKAIIFRTLEIYLYFEFCEVIVSFDFVFNKFKICKRLIFSSRAGGTSGYLLAYLKWGVKQFILASETASLGSNIFKKLT